MKELKILILLMITFDIASCGGGSNGGGRRGTNSQANASVVETNSTSATTPTPQPTPDPAEAVRKLTSDLGTALTQANADALDRLLSDGYVHINDLGQLVTKPDLVSGVRDGSVRFISVSIEEVNVRVYGDTAVTTATLIGTSAANGSRSEVQDRVTLVAAREAGNWRFVSGQTTPIHVVPQGGNTKTGTSSGGSGGTSGSGRGTSYGTSQSGSSGPSQ